MQARWVIIAALFAGGCASAPPPQTVTIQQTNNFAYEDGAQVASAALAFDPPLAIDQPPIDLSRSTRGEAAFYGFEDPTTSFYFVQTDDRRTTDNTDRYEREGFVGQTGAVHR